MKLPLIVVVLLCLLSRGSLAERTVIESSWPGAFKGQMTLVVDDCNSAINGEGWTVTVVFDQPVYNLDVWTANVLSQSTDFRMYELGNKDYNTVLYPNTYLTIEFLGYTGQGDDDGTRGTANINGNGLCSEGFDEPSSQSSSISESFDNSCDVELEIIDEWPGNVKGRVRLPLSTTISGGWTATLAFSEPIQNLQIWRASVMSVSANNQVYRLRNKRWNRTLREGRVFEAEFIATITGSESPSFSFLMQDHPACDDITSDISSVIYDNGVCSCGTVRQLMEEWENNFKGRVRVPVTNALNGGWTAELEFSEPVWSLQIWTAVVQSVDSTFTRYTLANQQWNPDLPAGFEFDAEFIGTISGAVPDFHFRLLNQPECECPDYYVPTTTQPTTTTSTTTAQSATTLEITTSTTTVPTTIVQSTTTLPTTAPTTTTPPTSTTQPTTATTLETTEPASTAMSTSAPASPTSTSMSTSAPASPTSTTSTSEGTFSPTDPMSTTKGPPDVTTQMRKGFLFDYDEVLHKSILFYEAQRSGYLPETNRIPYRSDASLTDVGENGEDLTGGWYDAGDTVKFGLPMASSATLLAWGLIDFGDAYSLAGEYGNALDSIRWATDYFIKCHVSPNEFYAQVGDGDYDHSLWTRPEDVTGPRPAYKVDSTKPGSDVAGETAAALAAASIIFKKNDPSYSATLLSHAIQLFDFANTNRGSYSDSIPAVNSFYRSNHYHDELAYAAIWLYRATNDPSYYTQAASLYQQNGLGDKPWAFSWDDKKAGVQILMYMVSEQSEKALYEGAVRTFLDSWLRGGDIHYTPGGLAWRSEWGALRYSANTAFIAAVACRELGDQRYGEFAREQIHYMLGSSGRSFVVGFGVNPPDRPHHRASSCRDQPAPCSWDDYNRDASNPQVLYGALVGGPDANDNYSDVRTDFKKNEVACDYNAGFQSAVAGVKQLLLEGLIVSGGTSLL